MQINSRAAPQNATRNQRSQTRLGCDPSGARRSNDAAVAFLSPWRTDVDCAAQLATSHAGSRLAAERTRFRLRQAVRGSKTWIRGPALCSNLARPQRSCAVAD